MLVGRPARSVRFLSALATTLALVLSGLVITSPTAAAADCTPMTDADLAFGAPRHSSNFESDPLCLELDEAPGTVVQVYVDSDGPTSGLVVTVVDSAGDALCAAEARKAVDCRLSGTGPFRVQAEHNTWGPWSYEVGVRRITDPVGCSTLETSAFGDPGEEVTTAPLEAGSGDCRLVGLEASPVLVNETGRTAWTLYDEDGSKICSRQNPICDVTSSGRKVLVHPSLYAGESTFTTAVVPLKSSTEGCGPQLSTSWSEPATRLTLSSLVQVDCRPLDASPGDRILGRSSQRFGGSSEFVVLDDTGDEVCERSEGYGGCVLSADGPYRIISYPVNATSWTDYTVSARNLTTLEGCPTIAVADFGTEPDDHYPGASCRQFEVQSAGRHWVAPRVQRRLFTADGREEPCDSDERNVCDLEAGRHVLAATYADSDFVTPLHDLTDETGCREGADTLSTRLSGTRLEEGYGCWLLPSPSGSTISAVRPLSEHFPHLQYFDATGKPQCSYTYLSAVATRCALDGVPPFRALVSPGSGDYRFAFMRLDDPQGCTELSPGAFDTLEGVDLTLDADVFARCLVVPEGDFTGQELFAFDRRSGSDEATLFVTGAGRSDPPCLTDPGARGVVRCNPDRGLPAPNGHTVLLQSTGLSDSSYRVVRRQLGAKASCTPVASTRIGGPATSGTTGDFLDMDCYAVEADPGDTVQVNLHTSTSGGRGAISAYDADGHWVCSGPEQCWLDEKSWYQVVVGNRDAGAMAGDYDLQSMLVKSASGLPLDDCVDYDDYSTGFGPLEATLDSESSSVCVTVPDDGHDTYGFEVENTGGGDSLPLHLFGTMGPWISSYGEGCDSSPDAFECSGFAGIVDDQYYDRGMLVLYRSDGPDEQPFRLTAFCASGSDCGDIFRVTGASSMTAPAETRTTVTLHGGRLYQGLDYKLVRDGHEDVVGTPVAGDEHDREVEFDLAGVEPGEWRLKVVSSAYGTESPGAFVVTQPHLDSTEPPEIRGDMRVDDRVHAYEGAWSAEPDSFTYQWQVNGRNIDWATHRSLRLRPWMRDDLVTVTVTAHKDGYVDATAASIWRRVYPAWPPQNHVRPRVKGIKHVGHWVRATHGTWSPKPRRFLYRWYLDGRRLRHQNHRRLFLRRWMRGDRIQVKVLARRPGYLQGTAWSRRWLVRR